MPGSRLTIVERAQIEALFGQGLTAPMIAVQLGRDRTTIWRELERNNAYRGGHVGTGHFHPGRRAVVGPVGLGGVYRWKYCHRNAQRKADQRARRLPRFKLVWGHCGMPRQVAPLWAVVEDKLLQRWSPMQISRWLNQEYPDRPEMWVSHETIYRAIYFQARGAMRTELAEQLALRQGRAKRRSQSRQAAAARTSRPWAREFPISARPAEIADRAVPGHWEGDLVIGARGNSAIVTLVERQTRFVMLGALPNSRVSEEVIDVLTSLMARLPAEMVKTLTWDQGAELAQHAKFTLATDCQVYFCDPHSPWQRGSNENTNGLLRQYFPRTSTDFRTYNQDALDAVARQLNGRPRKTLNWANPAEKMNELLRVATAT